MGHFELDLFCLTNSHLQSVMKFKVSLINAKKENFLIPDKLWRDLDKAFRTVVGCETLAGEQG